MGKDAAMAHERTRVVSLNTDSVTLEVRAGDEAALMHIIKDWEEQFGFVMVVPAGATELVE